MIGWSDKMMNKHLFRLPVWYSWLVAAFVVARRVSFAPNFVGAGISPRQLGRTSMRMTRIPEPGETTLFFGTDQDIPRQRAFNFALWDKHRKNPERYWNWFEGIFIGSTMIQRIKFPLLAIMFTAFLESLYDTYLVPKGWYLLELPIVPFNISASALGLLLTYRLQNTNARYNEARLIWGDIVNTTRDLMQMAHNWGSMDQFSEFASFVALYPAALMCMLRRPSEHDLKIELDRALGAKSALNPKDVELCLKRPAGVNCPMYVLHRMRGMIKQMELGPMERFTMEMNMTRLVVNVGACERILGTPIPVGFSIHTCRYLLLWIFLLPMALQSSLGMGTAAGISVLAFGLLGIEDVGYMLEEPFQVLPLEAMCNKIARESRGLQAANKKEMIIASQESSCMKFEVPKSAPAKGGSTGKPKAKGKGK